MTTDTKTAKAVARAEKVRGKQIEKVRKQIEKTEKKLQDLYSHIETRKAAKAFGDTSEGILKRLTAALEMLGKLYGMLQGLGVVK